MAPDSPPDSTADSDLRARVEQLEATVEAQQETIQQLLPSRRRVLQAGGLVAGGGVLGALTADRASADVTGQVGTQQDRVDVFGGAVDANSVNTQERGVENTESTHQIRQLSFSPGETKTVPFPESPTNKGSALILLHAVDNSGGNTGACFFADRNTEEIDKISDLSGVFGTSEGQSEINVFTKNKLTQIENNIGSSNTIDVQYVRIGPP